MESFRELVARTGNETTRRIAEERTEELLAEMERDGFMRFLWNRYFPWFFLADVLIVLAIVAALVWWWTR